MAKGLGHPEFQAFRPYDFKAANEDYMENVFSKPNMIVGAKSRVGIITCCDARSSPDQFFRMGENEAFVIRNGGGRTATMDVLRTIASIEVLSDIKELKVIHHTDCGALWCSDDFIRSMIINNDPTMKDGPFLEGSKQWAEALTYYAFSWKEGETERQVLERSVVEDVQFLRSHPLIKPSIPITGWIFNQGNGAVEEVDCGLVDGRDPRQIELLKEQLSKTLNGEAKNIIADIGKTAH
ncbi:hypothetical protein AYO21_01105 [Fonsecaea monophora]|uniref:Carbonic anhydrase n=2 Tax=Fonsecaea TaxID=40354 RepID=A0A0D2H6A7_9EURO|nr:uncharacterized protein Z517_06794 [Fonsecaea pedrosoi CBS 271.37]XP_022516567.1 hypothetical protein AYO21_01105 [Fonsecaea monophora]KAH0841661.1 carbonic anhydrase [Fonsecaea pedrosoi]KIW80179.1 hypothetical protein Z517_06794 [Fonsecaea pedrosoi CBS 271.37]OAG44615.1 hypothetical protein AYO21_01105 [Fonsecaea monophora]